MRSKIAYAFLGLATVAAALVIVIPTRRVRGFECQECRLTRTETTIFSVHTTVQYKTNRLTQWYGKVQPSHLHLFLERSGSSYNLVNRPVSWGNFGRKPLWGISSDSEYEFLMANFSVPEARCLVRMLPLKEIEEQFVDAILSENSRPERVIKLKEMVAECASSDGGAKR